MKPAEQEQKKRQEQLHEQFTDEEEAYHSAYPNVRAPWLTSAWLLITGKDSRGVLQWALGGLLAAALFWMTYVLWWRI